MKTIISFVTILILLLLSGCSINTPPDKTIETDLQTTNQGNNTQLSKEEHYCIDNEGKVDEVTECNKKVAVCILKDGTECQLDEFFNGYCEEGVIVEWGEECRGE